MLTHTNVLSTVVAMQTYCQESKLVYTQEDNVLSYLTMAHILGRVVEEFALSCGASIGYWQVRPMQAAAQSTAPTQPSNQSIYTGYWHA